MSKTMIELMEKVNAAQVNTFSAVNVLTSKVDSIEKKVDIIVEAIQKKNGKAPVVAPSVTVVKCDHCGVEIKSQKVIDYCKGRRMGGVFCPTCQSAKGLASNKFNVKENKPEAKGFKATCVYCGRTFKWFTTQEARREYLNKCLERGYKGLTCACCVNTKGEEETVVIELPESVKEKIQDTQDRIESRKYDSTVIEQQQNEDKAKARRIDSVQEAIEFLLGMGYTKENIAGLKIAELRKLCQANRKVCHVDGNTWNKTKATVLDNMGGNEPKMTFTVLPEEVTVDGDQQTF